MIKAIVRTTAALVVALFCTVQITISVCQPATTLALTRSLCQTHSLLSWVLTFAVLFAVTLLALSTRFARLRNWFAVGLLVAYAAYGFVSVFDYRTWQLAPLPLAVLIAAVGVALKARWGTFATYAVTAVFAIYIVWGLIAAARAGYLRSVPPLEACLAFVPGVTFLLLAGFCCYAGRRNLTAAR